MPSLLTLPKELLLHILSLLPLPIIESLARTHNYHITSTCLVLLQPLFARRRYIKVLKSRFKSIKEDMGRLDFEIFKFATAKMGIPTDERRRVREPVYEDWFERMEWLDLTFKHSLDWLQPGDYAQQVEGGQSKTAIAMEKIFKLEQDALQAGLRLPDSFVRICKNQALMDSMPLTMANRFHLDDSLTKTLSTFDSNAGGYSLTFCTDPDWEIRYLLYLTPDGEHCILGEDSVDGHGDVEVAGVGFDEWLAMMVFEQEIHDIVMDNRGVGEGVKEYVRAMYVRRPEELRKPTRKEKRMIIVRGGKVIGPAFPD